MNASDRCGRTLSVAGFGKPLYNNAFKYAMENSRIYVDVTSSDGFAYFTIKMSANPLNIHADELTESDSVRAMLPEPPKEVVWDLPSPRT